MSARERLRSNDVRFVEVAKTLSAEEWAAGSLCAEWTNHELLAHLVVGYSCALGTFVTEIVRRRGAFDPANAQLAAALASTRPTADLLDDFVWLVERPRGIGRYFPPRMLLGDHVTHELDILYAVNRQPGIDPEALVDVLDTQVSLPNPFVPAFGNSRGLKLVATDVDWTHGDRGPVVEGSAAELVSALGNRPKVLPGLHGDGVQTLSSRVLSRRSHTAG